MSLVIDRYVFKQTISAGSLHHAMNAPLIHVSISCVVRFFKVNVHRNISLASSINVTHMANELWGRFVHALQREGLRYEDLPETETFVVRHTGGLRFPQPRGPHETKEAYLQKENRMR